MSTEKHLITKTIQWEGLCGIYGNCSDIGILLIFLINFNRYIDRYLIFHPVQPAVFSEYESEK